MFCRMCGFKIEDGSKFCPRCGHRMERLNQSAGMEETSAVVGKENVGNPVIQENVAVFYAVQNAGVASLVGMILAIFSAVLCFCIYTWIPKYLFGELRFLMFIFGLMDIPLIIINFLGWQRASKIRMVIGNRYVSGTMLAYGFIPRDFKYTYDEISAVRCILGTLQLCANGKKAVFRGLENKERAEKVIRNRIS